MRSKASNSDVSLPNTSRPKALTRIQNVRQKKKLKFLDSENEYSYHSGSRNKAIEEIYLKFIRCRSLKG